MSSILQTSRGSVTIRPISPEEVAGFRELRLEALRAHPEAFGSDYTENLAFPQEFWVERVRLGSEARTGMIYVAAVEGTLIGMSGIRRSDGVKMRHGGMIWGVYVRQAWRGMQVSAALIEACIGWAEGQALRSVKLSVVVTNAAAIRTYTRHGFTVYGVEPEVILSDGVYYDELLMVRRIDPGASRQKDAEDKRA